MKTERAIDSRSDARLTILRAAAELIAKSGVRAVTTRAVAEVAGVQPPALYRLFGDKDGLLDALAEHCLESHTAQKIAREGARAEGDDPLDALRDGWLAQVEFGVANAELFLLLMTPGRAARSSAMQAGLELFRAKVSRLAVTGRLRVDVDRAMDILHASSVGAALAMIEKPESARDSGFVLSMFDAATAVILDVDHAPRDRESLLIAFAAMVPELPGLTPGEGALLGEWTARALASLGSEPTTP